MELYRKFTKFYDFFFTVEFGNLVMFLVFDLPVVILIFKNFGKWIEHVIAFSGLTNFLIKFIYTLVKSKGKISQNFVAFSEYMDFMYMNYIKKSSFTA